MSEVSRRGFIGSAAAAGMLALNTADAQEGFPFKNNVPDPLLSGKELPTFKFAAGKIRRAQSMDGSYGKEATVVQLPISKGIAGVSMRLEPGVMRELHWHATAAEWAFVIEGRCRTTVVDPAGQLADQRLRSRRRLVLSARPRALDPMPGQGAVPFHSDLRQRLFLGVRHVQHHRLARPHAQGAVGQEFRPARVGLRRLSEGRSLLRPRPGAARCAAAAAAGRLEIVPRLAPLSHAGARAALDLQGWARMARRRGSLSDFANHDRRGSRSRARRLARAALASHGRRMAIRDRRASERDACSARTAAIAPKRSTKETSATSRKAMATRSRTPARKAARMLIAFNTGHYQAIDLSQWIASNPKYVLAANFNQARGAVREVPEGSSIHRATGPAEAERARHQVSASWLSRRTHHERQGHGHQARGRGRHVGPAIRSQHVPHAAGEHRAGNAPHAVAGEHQAVVRAQVPGAEVFGGQQREQRQVAAEMKANPAGRDFQRPDLRAHLDQRQHHHGLQKRNQHQRPPRTQSLRHRAPGDAPRRVEQCQQAQCAFGFEIRQPPFANAEVLQRADHHQPTTRGEHERQPQHPERARAHGFGLTEIGAAASSGHGRSGFGRRCDSRGRPAGRLPAWRRISEQRRPERHEHGEDRGIGEKGLPRPLRPRAIHPNCRPA